MRRALLALSSTVAGLILLLSFKTHVPGATGAGTTAASGSGGSAAGAGSADMAGGGQASRPARSSGAPHRSRSRVRAVTGTVASTSYGPMQVRLTLDGHAITKVTVL